MLVTMLVLIMVARTPDDIPRLEGGTEPITELAFGLRKRPIPNPTRASQTAIWEYGVFRVNPDRKKKPMEAISRPSVLNPLAPHLSESHPLIGPTRIRVTSRGMRTIPACRGS